MTQQTPFVWTAKGKRPMEELLQQVKGQQTDAAALQTSLGVDFDWYLTSPLCNLSIELIEHLEGTTQKNMGDILIKHCAPMWLKSPFVNSRVKELITFMTSREDGQVNTRLMKMFTESGCSAVTKPVRVRVENRGRKIKATMISTKAESPAEIDGGVSSYTEIEIALCEIIQGYLKTKLTDTQPDRMFGLFKGTGIHADAVQALCSGIIHAIEHMAVERVKAFMFENGVLGMRGGARKTSKRTRRRSSKKQPSRRQRISRRSKRRSSRR